MPRRALITGTWSHIQGHLLPWLQAEVGPLTDNHKRLITVLEMVRNAENGESTLRHYALRDRAIAAGWPTERVRVIDCDLGKSGSTATARAAASRSW